MAATEDGLVHGSLTGRIIGAAMEVHSKLGAGFLESVYEGALAYEFELQKISFEIQKEIPVFYKNRQVKQFICDFLVDSMVIVEIKASRKVALESEAQLLNYLNATDKEVGLLLNFGPKPEIKRKVFDNLRK